MGRITYRRSWLNPCYWVIYLDGRTHRIMHISRNPRDKYPEATEEV